MIDYSSLTDEEFDELMELERIDLDIMHEFLRIPSDY